MIIEEAIAARFSGCYIFMKRGSSYLGLFHFTERHQMEDFSESYCDSKKLLVMKNAIFPLALDIYESETREYLGMLFPSF